ncbi:ATP-binding cassette domain-containing protein [Candidatus Woesearchaeota archaeon]|nr:ATP-binding cassette domain-containing protein [Candidatus Woesearchaeota archaeon]
MAVVIEAKNLTKKFPSVVAVDSVSLRINEGEIFGLLGPNGAGKTTLISMLTTLLRPTSGSAVVNGYDVRKNAHDVRASIGLVFQETVLDLDLTAYDNLDFHARLYSIPKSVRNSRITEAAKLVGLDRDLFRKAESFSGGMKRRLEVARGVLHTPKVLFLDEPTLGLDPQTRRKVWEYISQLRKKVTVLITTHYMEEADYLCDRVAIMDRGRIVALGAPDKLKSSLRSRKPTLEDVFIKRTGGMIRDEV